ncbi:MAG: hypothetical protein QM791_18445 [Ferruginibacter sp.]
MKHLIPAGFMALVILAGCKSTDYLSRADEDKTVFDVVKKLNKKALDEQATMALPILYKQVQERHLKKIETYSTYNDISRWDKIINEYYTLQNMFDAIDNSAAASKLVNATSYQNDISAARQFAAEDYYQLANEYFTSNNRDDLKKAYDLFKRADGWVSGYKDAKEKMDTSFSNSIVNVLINPVQDNSFFYNAGWGNTGYNYSNEYFQQNLVSDLGGQSSKRYPARFYTEWDARRNNIQPDWVVDLTLRNFDIPRPVSYNYSQNRSKQIEIGKDTAGKPVYQTVYATVNINRQSLTARGQMDINITDVATRKNITYDNFYNTFDWQQETASYSGDSRALTSGDWALVNNNYNLPRKEDILNELYRSIYPQVRNKISYETDW